jgi:phage recombination protein Bet
MSQARELTVIQEAPREITELRFTNDQLDLLKATIAKGTTDHQFRLFTEVAQRTGLNPFAKQIYAVVRNGQMTIQTGVDGYRLIAQRTGEYAGQLGPFWCGDDGEWRDVWLGGNTPPAAAKVGVLRHGFSEPVWGVALTKSYQQPQSPLWKTMPEVRVAKCAEVLALRKAFPQELSGLYADEEMHQADSEPMRPIQQPRRKSERARETVDAVTGEIVEEAQRGPVPAPADRAPSEPDDYDRAGEPAWSPDEFSELLKAAALTVSDLRPLIGPVTRDNWRLAVTAWLMSNPGKDVRDLIAAAVPPSAQDAEQAAFA